MSYRTAVFAYIAASLVSKEVIDVLDPDTYVYWPFNAIDSLAWSISSNFEKAVFLFFNEDPITERDAG